jgi:hypothetical protein
MAPQKKGEVIPFPTMGKLSAAFGSMRDELEKIAAESAGFTLKGGRPIKTSEFVVPVQQLSQDPITKKYSYKVRGTVVGGHGRAVTTSEETKKAPVSSQYLAHQEPEKDESKS